jgi:hypothetical protein
MCSKFGTFSAGAREAKLMTLLETIKAAVALDGYTLNQLAATSKLPKTTLHRYLTGESHLNSETLQQLCDFLELKPRRHVDLYEHCQEIWKEMSAEWWKDFSDEQWKDTLKELVKDADDAPEDQDELNEWQTEQYGLWEAEAYGPWEEEERENLLQEQYEELSAKEWIVLDVGNWSPA